MEDCGYAETGTIRLCMEQIMAIENWRWWGAYEEGFEKLISVYMCKDLSQQC